MSKVKVTSPFVCDQTSISVFVHALVNSRSSREGIIEEAAALGDTNTEVLSKLIEKLVDKGVLTMDDLRDMFGVRIEEV